MSALDDMHANLLAILGGGSAGSKTDWAASYLAALPLRDALALTRVWLAPAGYAVVPVKPSIRMCAAGGPEVRKACGLDKGKGDMHTIWAAMLAAAKETQA